MKSAAITIQQLVGLKPAVVTFEDRLPSEVRVVAIEATTTRLQAAVEDLAVKEKAWRAAVDVQAAAEREGRDLVSRVRSTVRGVFGPDAPEYQAVGGTRRSERRRRTAPSVAPTA